MLDAKMFTNVNLSILCSFAGITREAIKCGGEDVSNNQAPKASTFSHRHDKLNCLRANLGCVVTKRKFNPSSVVSVQKDGEFFVSSTVRHSLEKGRRHKRRQDHLNLVVSTSVPTKQSSLSLTSHFHHNSLSFLAVRHLSRPKSLAKANRARREKKDYHLKELRRWTKSSEQESIFFWLVTHCGARGYLLSRCLTSKGSDWLFWVVLELARAVLSNVFSSRPTATSIEPLLKISTTENMTWVPLHLRQVLLGHSFSCKSRSNFPIFLFYTFYDKDKRFIFQLNESICDKMYPIYHLSLIISLRLILCDIFSGKSF